MEPRRHRRGDCARGDFGLTMSELQWSHDVTVVEMWKSGRFEIIVVLASMEPRRHRHGDAFDFLLMRGLNQSLQWSHDVTVVEIYPGAGAKAEAHVASMEPRRHRRGDKKPKTIVILRFMSFNGATTSPSWRCRQISNSGIQTHTLQWSHDVTVVEIYQINPCRFFDKNASMEPRRHRRGDQAAH